jgi:antitoxin (DNA-binding transcriptional repressor) of toxin-antitoxin stability system
VVITVRGKPVADLVPHRRDEPRWIPREELVELLKTHSADPGLRDDLERIAGDTTDDLGPIR